MTSPLLQRVLPFLTWPRPTGASLRADLGAGIAVSLFVIPQSLAYAQLAGVPAHYGLYAALIPSVVGVLFGSSAILATGPTAMTALLTASSVGLLAAPGSTSFIAYVMLLALLSGLFQVALGLARAGLLLNLLSHPVLVGFVNAAALVIMLSQLPALTGLPVAPGAGVLASTAGLLRELPQAHPWTLACSALAIALLWGFKRLAPRLPGVLIVVVALTLLSQAIGFAQRGGDVVGVVPAGLPGLALPGWDWVAVQALVPAAFVIALVSFMEAMSSAKVIAARTRTRWDDNQELIGQGLAKVVAAFCQSMPVSASFSRSAFNLASGAVSAWSSIICAAVVALSLLLLTPALFHLPKPALAAMIVLAVWNLVDLAAMKAAWRVSRDDGMAATLTFFTTLAFAPNIQNGILFGLFFALAAFIYRRMLPRVSTEVHGAVATLRFDAALFFANASFFEDAVMKLLRENPGLRAIVVPAQSINLLDASGVEMLGRLLPRLNEAGTALLVSGMKPQVLEVAERSGLIDQIGRSRIFDTEEQAHRCATALASPSSAPEPELST